MDELLILNEDALFEMANIKAKRTGLPYDLWIDSMGIDRGNEHCYHPRIKIRLEGSTFIPIDISDDPKIPDSVLKVAGKDFINNLPTIKKYIKAYKDVLLAHYYKKIDDTQAGNLLSTIGRASEALDKLNKLLDRQRISKTLFHWDNLQYLYVIDLFNSSNELLDTIYASDSKRLNQELNNLKLIHDNLEIIEVGSKN